MIKLRNGAEVLRADLQADPGDESERGYVAARTEHGEFVTWFVSRQTDRNNGLWEAFHGSYFGNNQAAAFADYDRRRGWTV